MYAYDAERFRLWNRVRRGRHERPVDVLIATFNARAVFLPAPDRRKDGRRVKLRLHRQLEDRLGPPDFQHNGDVVYLLPAPGADEQPPAAAPAEP